MVTWPRSEANQSDSLTRSKSSVTRGIHGIAGEEVGQRDVNKRALNEVDLVECGLIELRPADNPGVFFEIRGIAVDARALGPRTRLPRGNDDVRAVGERDDRQRFPRAVSHDDGAAQGGFLEMLGILRQVLQHARSVADDAVERLGPNCAGHRYPETFAVIVGCGS